MTLDKHLAHHGASHHGVSTGIHRHSSETKRLLRRLTQATLQNAAAMFNWSQKAGSLFAILWSTKQWKFSQKSSSYRDGLGGKPTFVTCTFSSVSDDGAAQKQGNVAPQTFPLSGTPANHFASMDTNATALCHSKGQITEPNNNLESAKLCHSVEAGLKKGRAAYESGQQCHVERGLAKDLCFHHFF